MLKLLFIRIKKIPRYYKRFGFVLTLKKIYKVLKYNYFIFNYRGVFGYDYWVKNYFPSQKDFEYQRKVVFGYNPLVSILVPVFNPPKKLFLDLLKSVKAQTYNHWELVLIDTSENTIVPTLIEKVFDKNDNRVLYFHTKNKGIAQNTNTGLSKAKGEFVGFLDHDDELRADCLYENILALNNNKKLDLIYSDEYRVNILTNRVAFIHCKPDFSIDTLRTINYICHFLFVRKSLLEKIGGLRGGSEGSQDYDLILRLVERTKNIHHIPKHLYQWSLNPKSFSQTSIEMCNASSVKVLSEHLQRLKIPFDNVLLHPLGINQFKIEYSLKNESLVSIIIPSKDKVQMLKECVQSVFQKSTYKNIEIIVVDNNSEDDETFSTYQELKKAYKNFKIETLKTDEFNFSALANYGVSKAKGEYIILLNNDTKIITPQWIEEMFMYIQRDDVGVVGSLLLFPDDTIQHAGITLRLNPDSVTEGVAGNTYKNLLQKDISHYQYKAFGVTNVSAVTGACLMTKKVLYDKVKGFDDKNLKVAFNDVDFCLKIRALGKLIVQNNFSKLYHYESKTRGYDEVNDIRFQKECQYMLDWWFPNNEQDPFYNLNLTLMGADYSMNFHKKR